MKPNYTPIEREELRALHQNDTSETGRKIIALLDDCDHFQGIIEDRNEEITSIRAFLETHREKQNGFIYHESVLDGIKRIVHSYENTTSQHVAGMKQFRDDTIVALRALSLVADMVSSAGTHNEKNARLRGLIELLEGTINKLHREQFDFTFRHWDDWRNVWHSDFPARSYMEKIRELQSDNANLERQLKKAQGDTESNSTLPADDFDPFANE